MADLSYKKEVIADKKVTLPSISNQVIKSINKINDYNKRNININGKNLVNPNGTINLDIFLEENNLHDNKVNSNKEQELQVSITKAKEKMEQSYHQYQVSLNENSSNPNLTKQSEMFYNSYKEAANELKILEMEYANTQLDKKYASPTEIKPEVLDNNFNLDVDYTNK